MNYREVLIRLLSMTSPYVYDDEESFLQLMRKFYKMLNELCEATKSLSDDFEDFKIKYASDQEELQKTIEAINLRLDEFNIKIENTKRELKLYIDNELVNLRQYVDVRDSQLSDRITQIEIGNIEVYDPTTGLLSPIQTVINSLYESSRTDAITCTEYDELELTATEYDTKQLTATEFDTHSKTLLTE